MLVEDVLANEVGAFELLTAEGAEPFVLRQLLRVRLDELLDLAADIKKFSISILLKMKIIIDLRFGILGAKFVVLGGSDGCHGREERSHFALEVPAVFREFVTKYLVGWWCPSYVHNTASVGHLVFIRVLTVVVVVDGVYYP